MKITFNGASGEVTGSRHLVQTSNTKFLLDCGFFQGKRRPTRKLNASFYFDPQDIDVVVLSHAHLDHCGALPLLVNRGFSGPIYATHPTKDVARQMLRDSAGIQESDYKFMKKHRIPGAQTLAKPLYTLKDIPKTIRRFRTFSYIRQENVWHKIHPNVNLKFYDAGHILGSAVSVLDINDNRRKIRLAYTGDLGRKHTPLLHNPAYIRDKVDVMIVESTYGGIKHRNLDEAYKELTEIVQYVYENKSKLIVPAFALGRTQLFVYMLHHLMDTGLIPKIPVYVDSPLAGRVTEVFTKYRDDYDIESKLDFPRKGDYPLFFRTLRYTKSRDESKMLNNIQGPVVIISASGMVENGRILHHLKHSLRNPKNVILITGYQARDTLGRKLLEGWERVKIFGRWYKVNARIKVLNELSAHADGEDLTDYILKTKGVKKVFLVHGEEDRSQALRQNILKRNKNIEVIIPQFGQSFDI